MACIQTEYQQLWEVRIRHFWCDCWDSVQRRKFDSFKIW